MSQNMTDSVYVPEINQALKNISLDGLVSRGLIEEIIVQDEVNEAINSGKQLTIYQGCLLYTSPSPRD